MARKLLVGRGFGSALLARSGSSGVERSAQIYAALVLPFFVVFSIVVARVMHTLFLDFMPDSVAAVAALKVMLGVLILIATGAAWIAWVRTGGFGLFE